MLHKALSGDKNYWRWVTFLLVLIGLGVSSYLWQFRSGLTVTGLSRDVSWGLYIGQFTFLVGVAASAVMIVIPYYLHNQKEFGRVTVFGEFLAVSAVVMCMLFIIVDLGQPQRLLNILRYPTPNSVMFWDMVVLGGYLLLNILIGWNMLEAEWKDVPPPRWVKPLIYMSIPWAVSIHTVTGFLYAGLGGRPYWFTALTAARFLASAFAAGPALLIILCLIMNRVSRFEVDKQVLRKLVTVVTYAMVITVFFVLLEVFTCLYSQVPGHMLSLKHLFQIPYMWISALLAVGALVILLNRNSRNSSKALIGACIAVFVSLWLEKGLGFVVGGFVLTPFERVAAYMPTIPEMMISIGVWAIGLLILTILFKVAVTVKKESV